MQKRSVPTVTVVLTQFESLGRFSAKASGYGKLPFFSVPRDFENFPEEEIYRIIEGRLEEFISLLAERGTARRA
ncbi:MAG: hypothetical protein Q8O16_05435 [Dehalococcoidia bacterium]|nr:hypothetical protein [Dehalococcoidia bacterium]